jgi:hypothetical protein
MKTIDGLSYVTVSKSRWSATLVFYDENDKEIDRLIFSADSGITYGDGLFMGDQESYDDASEW